MKKIIRISIVLGIFVGLSFTKGNPTIIKCDRTKEDSLELVHRIKSIDLVLKDLQK